MAGDVDQFLMGTGGRSAQFKALNDQTWGTVVHSEVRQQSKFETGELMFWDDGKPRMQVVITLQTEEMDDDDDDGLRKVYAKGQMLQALRKAIVKAGRSGLADGGRLIVRYVSDEAPKKRGMSGAKQYFVKYEPPVEYTALPDEEPAQPDDDDLPF